MKNLSNLDLVGNYVLRGGFEVVTSLPTTNLFVGRQVCYDGKDYIYNGSAWTNDAETLDGTGINDILPKLNTPRCNLGNPSVFEAAVINSQFTNKLWFYPSSAFLFERSTDDITYTEDASISPLGLVSGNNSSNIAIPKGSCLRITITNQNYVFLNMLYMYFSRNGDDMFIKIEKYNLLNDIWTTVMDYTSMYSGWPGHMSVRHDSIPFANYNTARHFYKVRITIKAVPDTSGGVYPEHFLYGMEWWGGYPVGRRTIYSWDNTKNVYFPASVVSNETINCDINNIEPTQTGSAVTKTSSWWRQYLVQTTNFLWLKLKDLFSTNNDCYIPKIDNTNKKLVKSNINDDGTTLSYEGNLDLKGNHIENAGFEVVTSLPTNNFVGRRVTFNNKDYIWNGTEWESNRNWLSVYIDGTTPYMYAKLFTISNSFQNVELNLRPLTYAHGNPSSINYLLSFAYERVVINKLSSNPNTGRGTYHYNLHVKKVTPAVFEIYVGMPLSALYTDGLYADITNVRNSIISSVELFQTLDTSDTNVWTSLLYDETYFTEFHSLKTNKLKVNGASISDETINCDIDNIEPTQTGSAVTKTSSWWRQYFAQSINYFEKNSIGRLKIGDNFYQECDEPNNDYIGLGRYIINGSVLYGLLISYKNKQYSERCQLFLSTQNSIYSGLYIRFHNGTNWPKMTKVLTDTDIKVSNYTWDGKTLFSLYGIDFINNIYVTYNGTVDGVVDFINSTTFTTENRIHNIYLYLPANNKMIPKWPGCLSNIEITEALQDVMIKLEIKKINSKTLVNATILK